MKIKVFFHILDWPQGRHIIEEQIDTLIVSGILNHSEVFLHCNYDINNYQWLRDRLKDYPRVYFLDSQCEPNDAEIPTLAHLKNHCDHAEECYVLYIHHKGITRPHSQPVTDWRRLMMYFNVEQWRDAVAVLDQGYDTAGVNWRGNCQFPHYSGNFWWAKSQYIKKLPAFVHPSVNNYQTQFGLDRGHHRMDAEFWIGIGRPNVYMLHDTTVDHYHQNYPDSEYRK